MIVSFSIFFFFSSRRRHTILQGDWSSDVCSSDLGDRATLKLPSGEVRYVSLECMATIGQVGNLDHENVSVGKAGRVRWKGFRPTVRGTVMNPVDHPMGGGEGKGKGNHPMTPWGKPTKGYKTRRGARPSDSMIVTRRKK